MKIIKRNGTTVDFDASKIYNALSKAASSVYVVSDDLADNLGRIARSIETQLQENGTDEVTISMVQALVEEKLLTNGYIHIAEHYISYRLQRDVDRTDYKDKVIVHLRLEQVR
jgi:anaerobic ribonucleotide reductase